MDNLLQSSPPAKMDEKSFHVLVVDDEREIRDPLSAYLKMHGFRVTSVPDARTARDALARNSIDLMVLDIMMPGEDGMALCRDVHARSRVPIIFLTAMADAGDRICGLELGADDYMVKPFEPRELVAASSPFCAERTCSRRSNRVAMAQSGSWRSTYGFSTSNGASF